MKTEDLSTLLSPTVAAMGYELWGIECFSQGKHSMLRIYIDKEDGVTLDDCQQVSRQLAAVLEVEEPVRGPYALEVSSPGLERSLLTCQQFERYIGKKVDIKLLEKQVGKRNVLGVIQQVVDGQIVILADTVEMMIPFTVIAKAHLVYEE